MRLMLDMDSVMVDLFGPILDKWNQVFPDRKKTIEDMVSWDLADTFGVEGALWVEALMNLPGFFSNLPYMPGAIETIQELMNLGHDVIIVTAVPKNAPNAYAGKIESIKTNMPFFPLRNVFAASRKELIYAHLQFDDGAHNLEAFPGLTVAMDQPWNRKVKASYRVKTWPEFLAIVKDLTSFPERENDR